MNAATKNFVGLIAATLVAGALGLYAYFGVMKPEERETERKALNERLVSAHAAGERLEDGGLPPEPTFTALTVTAKGSTTVVERRADGWFITSPIQAKADTEAVEAILQQLATAKVKEQLEQKPTDEDLQRYGLAPPRFVLRARAHTGDEAKTKDHGLLGGIENPFDRTVFLRKEGDEAVYTAPASLRATLEKSTFDLRDKQVLALDAANVATVEVKGSTGARYSLQQDASGWKLTAPRLLEADKETVAAMFSALAGEHALDFPRDSPELRSAANFDRPALEATFTLRSGDPVRLRFGSAQEGKHFVLRESGAEAVVAEVGESAVTQLQKTAEDLRDKSVLRFDRMAAARLVFDPAGPSPVIELVRDPSDAGSSESWRVVRPLQGPAVSWKVSSLLWALSSLKAARVAAEAPKNGTAYGLERDASQAEIYGADGTLLARLTTGKVSTSDPALIYARGTLPIVFEVDKNRLTELPTDASALLDMAASPSASDAGVAEAAPN